MDIQLSPKLNSLVRLGLIALYDCQVVPSAPVIEDLFVAKERDLRKTWGGRTAGEIPELQPARRLYKAAGLDPTRNRPSSEALVRRVLRDKPLPRINSAVDLCNLAAVSYFLCIGLYDRDKICPPVTARFGQDGEHYEGLGKPRVNLTDRLCLEDQQGPFGNPSSDSKRTSVDARTKEILWVIYAPLEYDPSRLEEHLAWSATQAQLANVCQRVSAPTLIPPA